MARIRRGFGLMLPSIAASLAGSLAAGLVDGAAGAGGLVRSFAAAGYLTAIAAPVLLVGSLALRGLLRAWRPASLVRLAKEEDGGAPRLAAWLAYLLWSGWFLFAFTFNFVYQIVYRSPAKHVQALGSAIAVTAAAGLLAVLSYPAVRLFAAGLRFADRKLRRREEISLLRPAWILGAAGAAVAVLLWLGWKISVRPRIGHLDLAPLFYVAFGIAVALAVHLVWDTLTRRRREKLLFGAIALSAAVSAAAAVWVRHKEPYAMLEIWGETHLAGPAIDRLLQVQSLRRELHLPEFKPAEKPGAPHHDVVLITIDTFRADRAPIYGGPAKMPSLGRFARDSVVFDWALSPGNVTRRSLPTIATGLSPHRVRGRVAGWALRMDPRHVMLAERFRAAGYTTAGFFCCRSHFGPEHELGLIRGIDQLVIDKDGDALVEAAQAWLESQPERPLFVWFHFIEPHPWQRLYPRGDKYGRSYGERYDHSLVEVDKALEEIFAAFFAGERLEHTIGLITSDHGEGLGDHGAKTHATDLYNSQIRVPLVIRGPGIGPDRIKRPVGLVDVAPTLLDLAGFETPGMPQMDGQSLAPLLTQEGSPGAKPRDVFAVMVEDRSVEQNAWAIVQGRYKLIEPGGGAPAELYDITKDPDEKKNLAKEKPKIVRRLRERLKTRRELDLIPPF